MSITKRCYKTKDGDLKVSDKWSYKFSHKGKTYSGICYGCRTRLEAEEFEEQKLEAVSKITSQKSLIDLFNNCKNIIARENPVLLEKAYDLSLAKPRRRNAGFERSQFKLNHWNDFIFYLRRNYPTVKIMQDVSSVHAENYIAEIRMHGNYTLFAQSKKIKKLANATLNDYHQTLSQTFDLMKNETGMMQNPFSSIPKLTSDNAERDAFSVEQLQLILSEANDFLHPIFAIGLFTGARLGDICLLKKEEINFQRHFIYIEYQNKTGKSASIPMLPWIENYIAELINKYPDSEYLLPEHAAQYQSCPSTITKRMKKFLETDLEIDTVKQYNKRTQRCSNLDFHSLRHTFCTLAGVAGVPITVVQSIVGHMTPRMTEMYSKHVDEQEKLKFINIFGRTLEQIPMNNQFAQNLLPSSVEAEREQLAELAKTLPLEKVKSLLRIAC